MRNSTTPCLHTWDRRPDLDRNARDLRFQCVQCGCRGRKSLGEPDSAVQPATTRTLSERHEDDQDTARRAKETNAWIQQGNGLFHNRRDEPEGRDAARTWKDAA